MKRILIACEESQTVTKSFRKLGYKAFSCDIQPPSGGRPDLHFQIDAEIAILWKWDMIIAFPPCTHLASSGARWFKEKQADGRQQKAINFFMKLVNNSCPRIAIENPVGIMSTKYRKPDQIIQPWQFGHPESKATCLWLKGLPLLTPTNIVYEEFKNKPKKERNRIHYMSPGADRSKLRSKTYEGIAKAMAKQWGG